MAKSELHVLTAALTTTTALCVCYNRLTDADKSDKRIVVTVLCGTTHSAVEQHCAKIHQRYIAVDDR